MYATAIHSQHYALKEGLFCNSTAINNRELEEQKCLFQWIESAQRFHSEEYKLTDQKTSR